MLSLVPITIPHHFNFEGIADVGGSLGRLEWDVLRASNSPFALGAKNPSVAGRAKAVAAVLNDVGARRVCSYGVGGGQLEQYLEPLFDLTCTEYAPSTVAALRSFLPRVLEHDLRDGPLPGFDVHLLHRVDTELTNREWRRFFALLDVPGLFVVGGLLSTSRQFVLEWQLRRATRVGWTRSEPAIRRLFRGLAHERLQLHDALAFLVAPS